ncbi:MAG: hypothetical protein E6Q90_04875 [Actinobacteria bacterium]|nr:MAG: hypothetical protein E6Q90_04875 [Actinomycetota bacterium]
MKKSQLALLNDSERLLIQQTFPEALDQLDEDQVVELHARIRRARNKYVGKYRRQAAKRVSKHGGRGAARPKNTRAKGKAEVFEEALAAVSARLAVLAQRSADDLREQRLAAARAAKKGQRPPMADDSAELAGESAAAGKGRGVDNGQPLNDQSLRSPSKQARRAGTRAKGARRQAKRDSR